MRNTFLQSGGFAGLIRGVRLDLVTLPAAGREELERLVAACGPAGCCERSGEVAAEDIPTFEIDPFDSQDR
jgi:hypothetical protein